MILEAFSSTGKKSSFVDPTLSRTHELVILTMAENEDTNEVIAARREEHDRKHLLDNHKGKNTIHNKQLRKKIILLILK